MRALVLITLAGVSLSSANLIAQTNNQNRARNARQEEGAADTFKHADDALERVTWRTRTMLGNANASANWLNWRFGIAANGLGNLTFLEAVVRADAVGVNFIEGSSAQKVSSTMQKNLGPQLTAEEIAVVKSSMGGIKMLAYRTDSFGTDADSRKKLFDFAKAMGVDTIVAPLDAGAVAEIEKLADESKINVAFAGRPETVMQAIAGKSKRLSVAAETGISMEHNRAPLDLLAVVKDRLSYVTLRDRSALGADAQNVVLGKGVGKFNEFFNELNHQKVRPLILTLDTTGTVSKPADIFAAVDAFESTVQPAYGAFFTEWSKSHAAPRLDLDDRSRTLGDKQVMPEDEMRKKMAEAIKTVSVTKPKKARKLLVIESLHGMYHNPGIPNCNVLLEMMGKSTGAWETEFSDDLNNLKYPAIKKYDAVFVNSAVNEMFPDPLVRDGLSRFVKEGGGLAGIHGTPWASRNWQEFADMIGSRSAPHRIENGVIRAYDPSSPLAKPFVGKPLQFRDEFYRFQDTGYDRLMWENVRVLLAVDVEVPQSSPWTGYKRPDNIYPVSWIRTYGKGRTFYCSLGHMAETFIQPEIVAHLFSGVQFVLGDLDADTTPNPHQTAAK